jgi:glycosyltransferase involved in cell wall biosynthesis
MKAACLVTESILEASGSVNIDVVICTYNRAANLDNTLSALGAQRVSGYVIWSVLVVDNGSTDSTADVVEAHRLRHLLPGLRRVVESEKGLTPARRRGVGETSAPWIAFVDDDNLLDPGWLDAIARAIRANPAAGGIGGRVISDWEQPAPNFFKGFCCFPEQNCDVARETMSLVGAGLVVRRAALVECGWLERPLLADRVGKRLVSGGDIEITERIRAAGYPLWRTPDAVLRHHIPSSRATWRYLLRIQYGLAGGDVLVSALVWPGDWRSWRRTSLRNSVKGLARPLRRPKGLIATLARLSYAIGFAGGVLACIAMAPEDRHALLGVAVPKRPVLGR